jgi:hypothetical protein
MRRRRYLCLAAATLTLVTAGAAQGAPPQEPRTNSGTGPAAARTKSDSGGGLPFSGLDLALLCAGGGPLLLIGASLRRRRPKQSVQAAQEETLTLA